MAIKDLYQSANFLKFMEQVKELRKDSMYQLLVGEDADTLFRCQGAVTMLDAVIELPETMDAEDEAIAVEEDTPEEDTSNYP